MYIKDLTNGTVRKYGSDRHDSLVISEDGRTLSYENLQNGDESEIGEYRFCDEEGKTPAETECNYGEEYFNIGGWGEPRFLAHSDGSIEQINGTKWIPEDSTNGQVFIHVFGIDAWKQMIEFSSLNDQFKEFWNAPYKAESEK